ncbi:copper chaperone PCu(A)C [Sphingomonas gilva]|uniref:Copper chaperone PCu(A)C n=1 Tax=Sphingomonas gilva TaxID=2305907 RepID=A0A396RQN2_9SPHN|nr:copper chaperone PCu(A)C [Sphingomonas gilva]RHW16593.1 copper chaperone PCu(A)C [Sphingomonas gilva]
MKPVSLLAPFALLALAGCGQEPQLRVSDGWVRLAAAPGRPAAAYFTVHGGPAPARLISVDSSVVVRAEMHETTKQDGAMRMRPIESVEIPAEGEVSFAPGGKHVMFFNVNPGIKPGSAVPMIFTFADGMRIQYSARALAAGDPPPET